MKTNIVNKHFEVAIEMNENTMTGLIDIDLYVRRNGEPTQIIHNHIKKEEVYFVLEEIYQSEPNKKLKHLDTWFFV